MTCFYCNGDMEDSTTTHVVEIGDRVIIIRHVPCQKCKQCGEIVYSGSVVQRLEQITEQVKKELSEISIMEYSVA